MSAYEPNNKLRRIIINSKMMKKHELYYIYSKNQHCFISNVNFDVAIANKIINNKLIIILLMDMFWHLNKVLITFMGWNLIPNIFLTDYEISMFTTRLTNKEISYIGKKYKE